jgi:hypothetical protein
MSKQDELAAQPSVTLDAMADRSWVLFERRLHPPLYDTVIQLWQRRRKWETYWKVKNAYGYLNAGIWNSSFRYPNVAGQRIAIQGR